MTSEAYGRFLLGNLTGALAWNLVLSVLGVVLVLSIGRPKDPAARHSATVDPATLTTHPRLAIIGLAIGGYLAIMRCVDTARRPRGAQWMTPRSIRPAR